MSKTEYLKCPECKTELENINGYRQCRQNVEIDSKGKILHWEAVDEVLETQGFECPNCACDITNMITED